MIIRDYTLLEKITIIINYKFLKDIIFVIIIDYSCQKIIIIICYNRLFTPKLECGQFFFDQHWVKFEKIINSKFISNDCQKTHIQSKILFIIYSEFAFLSPIERKRAWQFWMSSLFDLIPVRKLWMLNFIIFALSCLFYSSAILVSVCECHSVSKLKLIVFILFETKIVRTTFLLCVRHPVVCVGIRYIRSAVCI